MSLTYTLQESLELEQERDALKAGVSPQDIEFSRCSGISPKDVRTFREYTRKGLLIIVRCPKQEARAWHGRIPAKPISLKDKTGTSGVAVTSTSRMFVSDYDLMSIWRSQGTGWRKVVVSAANGASRGPYSLEGTVILKELNGHLVSRIKHGCQDDFCSSHNPGVNDGDHFAVFYRGLAEHSSNPFACKTFYTRMGLPWLYSGSGSYLLNSARGVLG